MKLCLKKVWFRLSARIAVKSGLFLPGRNSAMAKACLVPGRVTYTQLLCG